MSELTFRYAQKSDVGLIMKFINELAEYEKMTEDVVATEETLKEWLFDKKTGEVIFPMVDGKEVGYALFFQSFSTFEGKAGMYLEDIYVQPKYRGNGYGKALFKKVADIAVERKLCRMDWICLDWNTPSQEFYKSMGAKHLAQWQLFRLSESALKELSEKS